MTIVVDYDPMWPVHFNSLRADIEPAIVGLDAHVEHVGSTAVAGLAAKPIIDVDVVLARAEDLVDAISRVEGLGYHHNGDQGIVGREAFVAPNANPIPHHLYLVVADTSPHRDHVDLGDHLRRHPDDVARYAERKRAVAHLYAADPEAYIDAKSDVIAEILARARLHS